MDNQQTTYYRDLKSSKLPQAEADVPLEWNVGDVILDLYEVTGLLGEGGMGRVYKAHHRGWNIDLAIKCPKPEHFQTEKQKENFVRECETWINLGLHPHIVSCHYVRTLGGIPRVFAEYVEGGSLKDWIDSRKLYEGGTDKALERILDIAIQTAWGLQYAHEQGVVHLDFKPGNVMMSADGTAKVTDFGLSRARAVAGEHSEPGKVGSILLSQGGMTLAYCSPEQAEADAQARAGIPINQRTLLTYKSDIWSWGVSVLEMFLGGVAWMSGQTAGFCLETYLESEIENPIFPAIPVKVADLLRVCFQEVPDDRSIILKDIEEDLHEFFQVQGIQHYFRNKLTFVDLEADALNNSAISLIDLGREAEARQRWEHALENNPQHQESIYNLGLLDWRQGKLTDTALLVKLRESSASNQQKWLATYLRAQVHLERSDCESAVSELESLPEKELNRSEVAIALEEGRTNLLASRRCLRTIKVCNSGVNFVYLSADNRYALSDSSDLSFCLWDISTGKCLYSRVSTMSDRSEIRISVDGRYALTHWEMTLNLWDISTGTLLRTFEGHEGEIRSFCLSDDSKFALSGSDDKTIKLWYVESGVCIRTFVGHNRGVTSVCLSQDTRFALTGGNDKVCLWEISTGKCLRTFEGTEGEINSICLSSDSRFALFAGSDYSIHLYEVLTGKCLRTFEGHTQIVISIILSVDCHFVLSGSHDGTLRLWEFSTGKCLRTFQGHSQVVSSVCLSSDGSIALSGSWDSTLRIWKVETQYDHYRALWAFCKPISFHEVYEKQDIFHKEIIRAREELSVENYPQAVAHLRFALSQKGYEFSPEAMELWQQLTMHQPRLSFSRGRLLRTFKGHSSTVSSVCLSAKAQFALSAGGWDNTLRLWNVSTGICLRIFEENTNTVHSACFTPDSEFALSAGSGDYAIRYWEISSGRCLRKFEGHEGLVESVCISADGRFALSGSWDKTLRLWEVSTGRCLRIIKGHTEHVTSVCLSSDGLYALTGSTDKTMRLWELSTGKCLRIFEGFDHRPLVCLSIDGRYAFSSSMDRSISVWDVTTGRLLRSFEGTRHPIYSICMSIDGRFILSGGPGLIYLWDVSTGTCLRRFEGHTGFVESTVLSSDGRFALSGSADKTIRLWELEWQLEGRQAEDWHEGARHHLYNFLILHTPYTGALPGDHQPTEEEVTLALTRRGKPIWNEMDFQHLLYTLGCAGYGWLRPEGVRRELERMAEDWGDREEDVRSLFQEANRLIIDKNNKAAMEIVKKIIQKEPLNEKALYLHGTLNAVFGNQLEANNCFSQVITINPNHAAAWRSRGDAFFATREYKEALACYENALKINPSFLEAWLNCGTCFYTLNQYLRALDCYEKALFLQPNNPTALTNSGGCYYSIKQYDKAMDCYDRALRIQPGFIDARLGRASCFYILQNYQGAIADLDLIIQENAQNPKAWLLKGVCLFCLKQWTDAAQIISKSLEIDPKNADAWKYRGLALNQQSVLPWKKDFTEILKCFNQSLALNPSDTETWFIKAEIEASFAKRPGDACESFKQFLRYANPEDGARIKLARNYLKYREMDKEGKV